MTPLQRVQRALESSGWLNCDPEDWEAVRLAAERYSWLRDSAGETHDGPYIAGKKEAPFAGEGWLTGGHADRAIDRARGVK